MKVVLLMKYQFLFNVIVKNNLNNSSEFHLSFAIIFYKKLLEKIMQLAVNISLPNILTLISQMSLSEIEEVKNKIVEKELYFKTFKKDKIENVINDFQKENYSKDFLKDLENGLKKSSVYNAN